MPRRERPDVSRLLISNERLCSAWRELESIEDGGRAVMSTSRLSRCGGGCRSFFLRLALKCSLSCRSFSLEVDGDVPPLPT
jgi:hypothetical protein